MGDTRTPFGVLELDLNGTRKLDDFHPRLQQPHPLQLHYTSSRITNLKSNYTQRCWNVRVSGWEVYLVIEENPIWEKQEFESLWIRDDYDGEMEFEWCNFWVCPIVPWEEGSVITGVFLSKEDIGHLLRFIFKITYNNNPSNLSKYENPPHY